MKTKDVSVHFAEVFNRSEKAFSFKEKSVEELLKMLKETAIKISGSDKVSADKNKVARISKTLKDIEFSAPDKLEEILDDVDMDDWWNW